MEWISVKEKLPEPNINVLVCNVNGLCSDEKDPVLAYYENGWVSVAWWDFNLFYKPIVTHWMQLPKLPEEICYNKL